MFFRGGDMFDDFHNRLTAQLSLQTESNTLMKIQPWTKWHLLFRCHKIAPEPCGMPRNAEPLATRADPLSKNHDTGIREHHG